MRRTIFFSFTGDTDINGLRRDENPQGNQPTQGRFG
jgi:hypothetical protein